MHNLFQQWRQLRLFDSISNSEKNGLKKQGVYYQYKPWISFKDQPTSLDLAKVTLDILKKMIDSLNGRQVIIPLSAGNDSRLIASGLKHLGYENVKCYSYGMPDNFETKIAKIVADKLGYDFKFLPLSAKEERKQVTQGSQHGAPNMTRSQAKLHLELLGPLCKLLAKKIHLKSK